MLVDDTLRSDVVVDSHRVFERRKSPLLYALKNGLLFEALLDTQPLLQLKALGHRRLLFLFDPEELVLNGACFGVDQGFLDSCRLLVDAVPLAAWIDARVQVRLLLICAGDEQGIARCVRHGLRCPSEHWPD